MQGYLSLVGFSGCKSGDTPTRVTLDLRVVLTQEGYEGV